MGSSVLLWLKLLRAEVAEPCSVYLASVPDLSSHSAINVVCGSVKDEALCFSLQLHGCKAQAAEHRV